MPGEIGRLGLADALRRAFDLTGSFGPVLGEGVVPVVQLLDLEESPFGVTIPFVRRANVAALAGEFSWAQILNPTGTANVWTTVEKIVVASLTAVHIEPMDRSTAPALTGSTFTSVIARAQSDADRRRIAETQVRGGTSVTAPLGDSTRITGPFILEGPWHFSPKGMLAVISEAVAQGLDVSFFGRIHFVAAAPR